MSNTDIFFSGFEGMRGEKTKYSVPNKALGLTLDMNLAIGASDHNTITDLGISSLIFCLESVKV